MEKKKLNTRKMVLCALFASLAFVLNTFVYFPAMAPFQHFVDVIAAVFLGPWWACLSAFLCGIMRMMCGRTIQSVTGAIFGPILGGLLWRKTKNIYLVCVGEIVGTGLLGALASYPLMKWFYALDAQNPLYYIPFYTPSAAVGGMMGVSGEIAEEKRLLNGTGNATFRNDLIDAVYSLTEEQLEKRARYEIYKR